VCQLGGILLRSYMGRLAINADALCSSSEPAGRQTAEVKLTWRPAIHRFHDVFASIRMI
jgi:hypothetical protein